MTGIQTEVALMLVESDRAVCPLWAPEIVMAFLGQ